MTLSAQQTKILGQFIQPCIVYVVLNTHGCLWTLNPILCCIFYIPNEFFGILNHSITRNQRNFWKAYENVYTFFSFTHIDSIKPIQLLKTYEKNVYNCIGFLHEYHQKKKIIQQYTQYNNTTACVNWPTICLLFFANWLCQILLRIITYEKFYFKKFFRICS